MTVVYDPTGTLSSNRIVNEIHTPVDEPAIFPVQGCFYHTDFTITGRDQNNVTQNLEPYVDFLWSPIFTTRMGETGKETYTFIVLTNYQHWNRVTLTYRASGGDQDTVLLDEITAAGNFDRTNINNWLGFQGDIASLNNTGVDFRLTNTGVAYLFASKLNALAVAMRTPASYVEFITGEFQTAKNNINLLLSRTNAWVTAFEQKGLLTADLADKQYVSDTINTAAGNLAAMYRIILSAPLNLYVSPNGDDDNDGLTLATPKLTRTAILRLLYRNYDLRGFNVTIHHADGIYTDPFIIKGDPEGSDLTSKLIIEGNLVNPENVILRGSVKSSIYVDNTAIIIRGMQLETLGGNYCIRSSFNATVVIGDKVIFGDALGGGHMAAANGGYISIANSYTINGSADYHFQAQQNSTIYIKRFAGVLQELNDDFVITINNNPTFAVAFAYCTGTLIFVPFGSGFDTITFTGTATGKRYYTGFRGLINVPGINQNFFPGTIAGEIDTNTNGLYV